VAETLRRLRGREWGPPVGVGGALAVLGGSAAAHRVPRSGLNLEATCRNAECAVHDQRVIVGVGYGENLQLAELLFGRRCPMVSVCCVTASLLLIPS
jgi:hypothetical protein